MPPSGTFVQVSAGQDHACGLKPDGTLVCWGVDSYGNVSTMEPGPYLIPAGPAESAIQDAVDAVASLVAAGALDGGDAVSLTAKLDAAQAQLLRGNERPAVAVLSAFVHQVQALANSGRMTSSDAEALIDAAETAIVLVEAAT